MAFVSFFVNRVFNDSDTFSVQVEPISAYSSLPLIEANFRKIEEKFGVNSTNEVQNDISTDTLYKAAHMFIYLNFCPEGYLSSIGKRGTFEEFISKETLKNIILFLSHDIFVLSESS